MGERDPYRVAVWGPGQVGGACIRDIVSLPEMELAGVFAYNDSKDGDDAGTSIGLEPAGVTITTHRDEFSSVDADVVLFCARDFGDFGCDEDILALLESGKNVITPLPYLARQRGAEVAARYAEACDRGGSSFHVAGVDPNFVIERLLPLLTGMSNHIEQIRLHECALVPQMDPVLLGIAGFGITLDEFADFPLRSEAPANYFELAMWNVAEKLGRPLEKIERVNKCVLAEHDIVLPHATIRAGTIGIVWHQWVGYSQDVPFFTSEATWYLSDDLRPEGIGDRDDVWILGVEGRPSAQLTLAVTPSLDPSVLAYPDDPTTPVWYFTSVPLVQAIPFVVDAPPGVVETPMPSVHWKPDMRLG